MSEYRDIREAQEASRRRVAVSGRPVKIALNGGNLTLNKTVLVDIAVKRGKDPVFVYHSAQSIEVPFVLGRPTSRQVDEVREWKAG